MPSKLIIFPLNKLSSLFFRMTSMAAKFAVFVFLSKYFSTEIYGVYTLIATTITIAIFVLGLDFYSFMIRDILIEKRETASKLGTAFFLYGCIYFLFALLGGIFFNQVDYLSNYAPLLVLICITEHFNQEVYRLLLAFKRVLTANWFLFFRVAGWAMTVVLLIVLFKEKIGLQQVLMIWGGFNLATILFVFSVFFKKLKPYFPYLVIKWEWLKKGLKISMVFYAATIALKIIEYSNRYIVEGILGEAAAGIFSFYANFAMLVTLYVSTIVVSYEMPALIESSTTEKFSGKMQQYKKMLYSHTAFASVVSVLAIYPVLLWQGKESFEERWPLAILLTFGMFLMNISLIYHAYLYIRHREWVILKITLISGTVNVAATFLMCRFFGLYGAGVAFAVTGITMYFLRKKSVNREELNT